MKKILLPLLAIALSTVTIISCDKGVDDALIQPIPSIQHPDSTQLSVVVPSGTTGTLKMVGNMIADYCDDGSATANCGWQPGSNVATVILDKVNDTLYQKRVAISIFTKDEFEFKFVNGDAWGKEETKADGSGIDNRKGSKGSYKGKTVDFTVARFN